MRLAVVNCIHAGAKPNTFTTCGLKLHGGRPGVAMCRMCLRRLPRADGEALAWVDGEKPKPDVEPVPRDDWPAWAKAIEKLRAPEDIGVGSTVDRQLGTFGKVYKATLKGLGVPCGCNRRKAEWDVRYPYSPQQPQQ